ncbi:APC family permease (plasmid) [Gemmobacter fulvus]|uniref:APC family permease n=1 Tax=Gemmobacter fulvus TaxID=2840474 RepID=A0A975PA91_9RHOB|nr:APC family permease [Gemmobacter fulvus]MBT9246259.1 APC family permease [Gemmobacter fulvus]QWK92385.1 APC family permease [Gemmobacter fulvus]
MAEGTQTNQLRPNTLGAAAITFLVVSAAAPLTAVAGGVPLAMLLGNGVGVAGGFAIVSVMLLLFAVGYVAMSRHVRNAGAFYAFAAQGLGGHFGGAAALVAILSYNCMQIGILGLLGAASSATFATLGLDLPWWVWSYIAIAATAVLGYRQVDLSARILVVLVALEYLIVLIIDGAILFSGGDSGLSMAPFEPSQVFSGVPSIGILFCFAAFIGFEATTIYSEEARDPQRSIPKATYGSVLLIGVFYMITAWLMANGAGVDKLLPTLQGLSDPTTFLFDLAARYVGGPVPTIMGFLFISSLFAAVLAFHNGVARYKYVAGREGLLPDRVGRTHADFQSPHVGSVIQTLIAILVIGLFAAKGMDPVLQLFTWLTQLGTLGILGLMGVVSFAVIGFFVRKGAQGESVMATKVLPLISGLAMLLLFGVIFVQFGALTGAEGWLGVALPSLVPLAGLIGLALAWNLKTRDSIRFGKLGQHR